MFGSRCWPDLSCGVSGSLSASGTSLELPAAEGCAEPVPVLSDCCWVRKAVTQEVLPGSRTPKDMVGV